jgi:hypothetical protein
MTAAAPIEIPLSKKKMALTLAGSIIFVGIGSWLLINPPIINHPIFGNPLVILIIAIAAMLFFGLVAVTVSRKLLDKKAGLIINSEGIIDNSSGVSAGLILWTDIEAIELRQVMNQQFLMIMVKHPKDYIDRVSNPLRRKAVEINYNSYGSPISISANSLQINFNDLGSLLTEKMNAYK